MGYEKNHDGDCYRMLNLETLFVLVTRNVIWLKRIYFAPAQVTQVPVVELVDNDNTNTIKAGEIFVKGIFDGNYGVNALTHVESYVGGITNDDGNAEGNIEAGDDTNDSTGTDENTNDDGGQQQQVTTTKLRRVSGRGKTLSREQSKELGLTEEQTNYYALLSEAIKEQFAPGEIFCVGSGLGGVFASMHKLHVMKCNQAMAGPYSEKCNKVVQQEHELMEKHKVWRAVSKYEVPKNAKVVTSTWAMKKKSNETYRARLNARGFNKCDQDHYNGSTIAAPVTNEEMVRIVTALMVMARWGWTSTRREGHIIAW